MARGNLMTFSQETGMVYDKKRKSAYGNFNGYQVVVQDVINQKLFVVSMNVNGGTPEQANAVAQYLLSLSQQNPNVKFANFNANSISISVKSRVKNNIESLKEVLNAVTSYCRSNSMVSCCKICGAQTDLAMFSINGNCVSMCNNCFEKAQADLSSAQQEIKKKKGNIVTGIVGALLGSLIGVVLWVIVYQVGYIAGLVGLVLAVCTIKGYEKFGGKLNVGGIVISMIIAVGMLFLAENICVALEIYNQFKVEYDINFFDAFRSIPDLLGESEKLRGAYLHDLGIGYLFMIVGSFSSIMAIYKNANLKHEMTRLSMH
ncbi:MAG TPA: hypothetical protein VHO94_01320 [Oscillospiraceae bacterium]|nr:hypothetical protein [Oscillospiraceae bacterium]